MYYPTLVRHFFSQLEELDAQVASQVAAAGCRHCGGPLHRSDYLRKPRGALMAEAGESVAKRHSLCCGRRGCRRRALPPSLRFLGRRVYLEAVVVLTTVFVQMLGQIREVAARTGVPAWTLRRWRAWWQSGFPRLPVWQELARGLFHRHLRNRSCPARCWPGWAGSRVRPAQPSRTGRSFWWPACWRPSPLPRCPTDRDS